MRFLSSGRTWEAAALLVLALLARSHPRTLRWLNATEAVEEFLGQTIEQLRQRSLRLLHADHYQCHHLERSCANKPLES